MCHSCFCVLLYSIALRGIFLRLYSTRNCGFSLRPVASPKAGGTRLGPGAQVASAEVATKALIGMGSGERCRLPSRLGGLGSAVSSASGVQAENALDIFVSQDTSGEQKNAFLPSVKRKIQSINQHELAKAPHIQSSGASGVFFSCFFSFFLS